MCINNAEEHEHAFDSDFAEKYHFQPQEFDRLVELRPLTASAETAFRDLRDFIRSSWTDDLKKLIDALGILCPPWQARKNELLSHAPTSEMLLSMPDKHVASIGPVVGELIAQRKLVESTGLLDASTLQAVESAETLGRETLVYGLVTKSVHRDWHRLKSPAEAAAAVAQLRAAIAPKGVTLTAQMESELAEWSSGAKIAALHAARLAAAARSPLRRRTSSSPVARSALEAASSALAPAAAPAAPDAPAAVPAAPAAAALPAAAPPPAAVAEATAAPEAAALNVTPTLSLAQRVAAAKRRKLGPPPAV